MLNQRLSYMITFTAYCSKCKKQSDSFADLCTTIYLYSVDNTVENICFKITILQQAMATHSHSHRRLDTWLSSLELTLYTFSLSMIMLRIIVKVNVLRI